MYDLAWRPVLVALGILMLVAQPAAAGEYHSRFAHSSNPLADACRPDYWRYCKGVVPGKGRILSCLAGNRDRLSWACGAAVVSWFGPPHSTYEERWTGQFVDRHDRHDFYDDGPLK